MQSIYNTRLGSNLGLDTTGYAGYETIAFDQADRDDAQVTHVPIFDIADPKHWIGIFGLNPQPTNFSTLNNPQPSFMQRLYDQNSTPSRSFGYTAGARHRSDEAFGSLTLGGYDPSRFVPTDTTFAFYPDVERNLLVNLRSVSANATGRSNLLPDGQIGVHLDSTAAAVWLPESACKAFEATFHISWNDKVQRYIVNDSHHAHLEQINPIITFNLVNASGGSVDIDLPYTAFALTASFPIAEHGVTTRYFALRCAANDTQYTLGRVFFQEAYLIADYDRGQFTVAPCDWVTRIDRGYPLQPILSPQITANTKCEIQDPRHTLSRGGTAGVVVGCVAVVALISLPICVSDLYKIHNSLKTLEGGPPPRPTPRFIILSDKGVDSLPHVGELCGLSYLGNIKNRHFRCPLKIVVNQCMPTSKYRCTISIKSADEQTHHFGECEDKDEVDLMVLLAHLAVLHPTSSLAAIKECQSSREELNGKMFDGAISRSRSWTGYQDAEIHIEIADAALHPMEICVLHGVGADEYFFKPIYDRYLGDGENCFLINVHSMDTAITGSCSLVLTSVKDRQKCAGILIAGYQGIDSIENMGDALEGYDLGYGWHNQSEQQGTLAYLKLEALLHRIRTSLKWTKALLKWERCSSDTEAKFYNVADHEMEVTELRSLKKRLRDDIAAMEIIKSRIKA
ncbi:hypothetical protein Q7P37_007605 [Cladosporium fusiforme]